MHKIAISQSIIDRVIARRGREHIHDDLDPARTALVVVDMQNAFMLPGVAHALCLEAQEIVPNINRLAQAVRETGGAVVWIQTAYTDETKKSWSVYYDISKPEQNAKRAEALARGSKGYQLWETLDARQHERVLHVDHDQRGARRIEIVMDVLAAAPRNHAIDDRLRNGDLVHRRLLVTSGW